MLEALSASGVAVGILGLLCPRAGPSLYTRNRFCMLPLWYLLTLLGTAPPLPQRPMWPCLLESAGFP